MVPSLPESSQPKHFPTRMNLPQIGGLEVMGGFYLCFAMGFKPPTNPSHKLRVADKMAFRRSVKIKLGGPLIGPACSLRSPMCAELGPPVGLARDRPTLSAGALFDGCLPPKKRKEKQRKAVFLAGDSQSACSIDPIQLCSSMTPQWTSYA